MFGLFQQSPAEKLNSILGVFNQAKSDLSKFIVETSQKRDEVNDKIFALEQESELLLEQTVKAHNSLDKISAIVGE